MFQLQLRYMPSARVPDSSALQPPVPPPSSDGSPDLVHLNKWPRETDFRTNGAGLTHERCLYSTIQNWAPFRQHCNESYTCMGLLSFRHETAWD